MAGHPHSSGAVQDAAIVDKQALSPPMTKAGADWSDSSLTAPGSPVMPLTSMSFEPAPVEPSKSRAAEAGSRRRRTLLITALVLLVAAGATIGALYGAGVLKFKASSDADRAAAASATPTFADATTTTDATTTASTSTTATPTPTALSKVTPSSKGILFGAHLWGDHIDWTPGSSAKWNELAGFSGAGFGSFSYVDSATGVVQPEEVLKRAQDVKKSGGFLLFTVEPAMSQGLDMMTDLVIGKIADLAKAINDMGVPVMLRFAHEMNGSWNPWGQRPKLYRETWIRLTKAIRAKAPFTSMVWSPNGPIGYPWAGDTYSAKKRPDDWKEMDTNGDGNVDKNDDPYSPFFPGVEWVDWIGGSIFRFDSYPFGKNELPQPNDALDMLMGGPMSSWSIAQFAQKVKLPLGAFETGIIYYPEPTSGNKGSDVNKQQKQMWLAQLMNPALREKTGLALIMWFEIAKVENNQYRDFSLFKDPLVAGAIREDFKKYAIVGASPVL
ncbi:hypothetical protein GGF31_005441 [Allomyces arbusculus]|nr:hypothetical protein GGF31_005441 [Allomyces arbusculus]